MDLDFAAGDPRSGLLFLFLCSAYVAYIASGALPSSSRPARRKPGRVLLDRAGFALVFLGLPFAAFLLAGLALPGATYLRMEAPRAWLLPTAVLGGLAWALGRYSRKDAADMANYPQFLPVRWGVRAFCAELLSWLAYLFAYEFVFRGMILELLLPLGSLAAIGADTALYAFAHLSKSPKEAAGCVLFGVVACVLTLVFGSLYPAFLIHAALALGNDRGAYLASRAASAPHAKAAREKPSR